MPNEVRYGSFVAVDAGRPDRIAEPARVHLPSAAGEDRHDVGVDLVLRIQRRGTRPLLLGGAAVADGRGDAVVVPAGFYCSHHLLKLAD